MLRLLMIMPFLFASVSSLSAQDNAQENAQSKAGMVFFGQIGVTFSGFGSVDVIQFEELDGAGGYTGEGRFSVGVTYIHPLTKWLAIEGGIEYTKAKFNFEGNVPGTFVDGVELSIINIPITSRVIFLKYLFANVGMLFDIDTSDSDMIDKQSGLGAMFGVGASYDFKFGMTVFVNPYYKLHTIVPSSPEKYHERVADSGLRFGITYRLKKLN